MKVRTAPPVRPAATVQSNAAPLVKPRRNSAPTITNFAGTAGPSESSADDYGQNFGQADETLPSAEADVGADDFDIDEIDFSENSDDAVEDDSGEAESEAAVSTTNSGTAGADPSAGPADLPAGGGDTSSPPDAGPPTDKRPKSKDTGPGEELGTTAPPTSTGPEVRPAGAGSGPTNGPAVKESGPPTGGGGGGNGPPSKPDDGWTRPPNPGPGLNGYEPKPYPDRFDPKRPGQENWEWSIEREPFKDQRHPFTYEKIIDPRTGRDKDAAGVGLQWNVGHPPQRDIPRPTGPRENEIPYYNALPAVPEQQPPASATPPATAEPPWDPTKRSSDEIGKQDLRPTSRDTPSGDRLQSGKDTANDGVPQVANEVLQPVGGVDPVATMQHGDLKVLDAGEKDVETLVHAARSDKHRLTDRQPQRPGKVAQRAAARSEQGRGARKEQEFADQQRAREDKARRVEGFRAAEKAWQATEGAEFGRTHGPRPKNPEQAQQWDRDRVQAIRNHRQKQRNVKRELESTTSEESSR